MLIFLLASLKISRVFSPKEQRRNLAIDRVGLSIPRRTEIPQVSQSQSAAATTHDGTSARGAGLKGYRIP